MNSNKIKATMKIGVMFLLLGTTACNQMQQSGKVSAEEPTKFKCIKSEGHWSTFAVRENKTSKYPLFIWDTTEFGDKYTPDNRCKIVSDKLTKEVAKNGGRLDELRFDRGTVNNYLVVCVVKKYNEECNGENQLFTLNQNNKEKQNEVIQKIQGFGKPQGASKDKNIIYESGNQTRTFLKDVVDKLF